MKLKDWAKLNGISYRTAWRWFHQGTLPVPAHQVASGSTERGAAIYARVSSSDQRADLDRQVARLTQHAVRQGLRVATVVAEVGSGMNGSRAKLLSLLRRGDFDVLVVEHRDRLSHFGLDYLEAALTVSGRRVQVVEQNEFEDDLVRDMCEVLTSFCARLYGRRSAKCKAAAAVARAYEA